MQPFAIVPLVTLVQKNLNLIKKLKTKVREGEFFGEWTFKFFLYKNQNKHFLQKLC